MYDEPHVAAENEQRQEMFSSLDGLLFFLECFDTCFQQCVEQGDRECFRFCVQRLFASIDTLYLVMLPELSVATSQKAGTAQAEEYLAYRYKIWTSLRDVKRLVEHIEPYFQLLNGLAITMLEALDLREDQLHLKLSTPYKERAFTALTERLNDWRQYHSRRPSFVMQFSELLPFVPSLAQADAALDSLLDYAISLFGEILPAFYSVQMESRDRVATWLLDMMQKIDLLLVQISMLLEALYLLLQYHAPGSATYSQPDEKTLNMTVTAPKPLS